MMTTSSDCKNLDASVIDKALTAFGFNAERCSQVFQLCCSDQIVGKETFEAMRTKQRNTKKKFRQIRNKLKRKKEERTKKTINVWINMQQYCVHYMFVGQRVNYFLVETSRKKITPPPIKTTGNEWEAIKNYIKIGGKFKFNILQFLEWLQMTHKKEIVCMMKAISWPPFVVNDIENDRIWIHRFPLLSLPMAFYGSYTFLMVTHAFPFVKCILLFFLPLQSICHSKICFWIQFSQSFLFSINQNTLNCNVTRAFEENECTVLCSSCICFSSPFWLRLLIAKSKNGVKSINSGQKCQGLARGMKLTKLQPKNDSCGHFLFLGHTACPLYWDTLCKVLAIGLYVCKGRSKKMQFSHSKPMALAEGAQSLTVSCWGV